jgi:hypothetical protein
MSVISGLCGKRHSITYQEIADYFVLALMSEPPFRSEAPLPWVRATAREWGIKEYWPEPIADQFADQIADLVKARLDALGGRGVS